MNTKSLTFAVMMGALGSALFAISYSITPIAPSIAFDFSLIGVLVAGYYGGPKTGFLTGLIAGILPGIMFGPMGQGGALALVALPFGKALTGMMVGLLSTRIKFGQKPKLAILAIPATLLAFIPETLFTWGYFLLLFRENMALGTTVYLTVLTKALIEVPIMGIVMMVLLRNNGFSCYVRSRFFPENTANGKQLSPPAI
jgi:riboflavin transporter FmnP